VQRSIKLEKGESELLLEVLAYMGRRFFDPTDQTAILGLEEHVERARRADGHTAPRAILLDEAERGLLLRVLASYIDELHHPASAGPNRTRVSQIQRIGRRVQHPGGLLSRLLDRLRPR